HVCRGAPPSGLHCGVRGRLPFVQRLRVPVRSVAFWSRRGHLVSRGPQALRRPTRNQLVTEGLTSGRHEVACCVAATSTPHTEDSYDNSQRPVHRLHPWS